MLHRQLKVVDSICENLVLARIQILFELNFLILLEVQLVQNIFNINDFTLVEYYFVVGHL